MAAAKVDYYDILGVSKGTNADDIKKAYRKQALEWHPDRHKDNKEAAEKRFKEINEAYQVLSDPKKKQAYDQFGHQAFTQGGGFGGSNPFGQGGQYGPFTYTYTTNGGGSPFSGFDFGDPFDIFEQFFGGGTPFRRARTKPRYSMTVDFDTAIHGATKEVQIEGKKRKIKIPAGVDDGSRIEFDDFTLSINVKPDPRFERDGADIYLRENLDFTTAALGGEIEVPTVDDTVKLRIRAGTKSGTMIRLRGKGMPNLRGNTRGDQYVRITVDVPDKLTGTQK
ncbi:MAG: hypothetical protein ACD_52C00189G0003, partial [uncultured bacterium]